MFSVNTFSIETEHQEKKTSKEEIRRKRQKKKKRSQEKDQKKKEEEEKEEEITTSPINRSYSISRAERIARKAKQRTPKNPVFVQRKAIRVPRALMLITS